MLAPLLLAAALTPAFAQEVPAIRPAAIRAHLAFLADDLLEGRAPGTRGEALGVRYIASQLARAGVEPIRGSYFQPVPLVGWTADARRTTLQFATPRGTVSARYRDDAVLWLDSGADSATVRGELVFAGYGAEAPEFGWSDFKGRDVRGRILVVLSGDPPAPPGQPLMFGGPALTYYGRYTYKIEEAARQGAAAVIIVHTTEGAGYAWQVVQSSWTHEQLALRSDPSNDTSPVRVQGWLTFDRAGSIFENAGLDLDELFVRAARRDFQPVFTGIQAQLTAVGRTRAFTGVNVAGMVNGSHATRRDETVIYTAHHDHLGIGAPVNGDSIYNGAYDNASGVALLLEVASAFAALEHKPDRSVMFLFTTAEETGLLGSTWYVRQPLRPMDRTVAALNIDGANVWGETRDVSAVGLERSTLGVTFERQAAALGLRVSGDRAPGMGLFFRSDHFPFARAGVPALYIGHGTDFLNRSAAWSDSVLISYQTGRYHRPSDHYDPRMTLIGAAQQGHHAFLVGLDVARATVRPRVYPDSTDLSGGR